MRLPGPRSPVAQLRVASALVTNPMEGFRGLQRDYGEVVAFGAGPFRYVALFGPAANRFILADHPECFAWHDAMKFLAVVVGDTALVVTDGDEHRRRRRLVQPAFATRAIHRTFDLMVDEIDREIDTWPAGSELDVYETMRRAIRRVAVGALFGDSLGARADELGESLAAALTFVNRPLLLQIHLDVHGSAWRRARQARDSANGIINDEIARRRATPGGDRDLLDALLTATDDTGGPALDDQEIRDQIVSLIAAGYDTTSATAGWAVHELLTHPGAWDRAAEEVAGVVGAERLEERHLSDMVHLDHVVRETLRLWPAGAAIARKCVTDVDFGGYCIPAGTMVLYSAYVTHRMAELWPNPDHFEPDRWANAAPDPYAFVAFGGGHRRCLGFAFATQELKVLLVQLLRRTRLQPLRRTTRPTGLAALRPKGGVPVRITTTAATRLHGTGLP